MTTAAAHYGAAMSLASELEMRPPVTHLGKLYCRSGDAVRAREHLTTATGMYGEMGMRLSREQADAAMTGLA